jgi:DNA-binding PadR family transcriptional regulator
MARSHLADTKLMETAHPKKKFVDRPPFPAIISATDISVTMAKSKSAPEVDPADHLPLTPAVFHVLLALADGERHGYAIMQEVTASTDGQIKMGPGTLYGTIKRLLEAQLIEESDDRPDAKLDDERRRYYRLTGVGEKVVRAEAQRYAALVAHARGKKLVGKVAMLAMPGIA